MKIAPSEELLIGEWVEKDGRIVPDDACMRIVHLVSSHLQKLGTDSSGWNVLYRDPDDGRLWELTYPQSQLHGGGPPQLRRLAVQDARNSYGGIGVDL
jgi:hypothetical protein